MIDINELRRLAQAAKHGPDGVSLNWLKLLQDFQKEANPATVIELLDRIEAAEKERESWKGLAQQFGNELDALRAKVEQLTEAEAVMRRNAFEYQAEAERLRARIEQMERQEPVAWLYEAEYSSGSYSDNYFEWRITRNKSDLYGARKIKPLIYKTPRAKGE